MRPKAIILSLGVFAINLIFGIIPHDWYYGRQVNYSSVASLATGGVELFEPSVLMPNPLQANVPKFIFSGAYQLSILGERRTQVIFDQYDNTIGEIATAENNAFSSKIGKLTLLVPSPILNVEFNFMPAINYDYYFYQEFRDDFYTRVGEEELSVRGALYKSSLLLGKQFFKRMGAAAGIIYFYGTRNYHYKYLMTNYPEVIADTLGNPRGWGFSLGGLYSPSEKLIVTAYYASPVRLIRSFTNNQTVISYPWTAKLNIAYLASGEIPTKLGVFCFYSNWQKLHNSFQKVLYLGVGVEHTLLNLVALRYGFRIEPSFVKPTANYVVFTIGWGFDVGSTKIDFGGEIGRREIYPEHFITDINADKIYENILNILVGIKVPLEKLW
ncbi:MAG: hypothetical protein N2166_02905 [candidate division WOR-3 bacterium]|nr:hypothetical protein [candidate division WOR-3 bacterium]